MRFNHRLSGLVLLSMLIMACAPENNESTVIAAQEKLGTAARTTIPTDAGANPWTHLDFKNDPNDFSFAIVSDLTGGERSGVFDVAVADLNLLMPEFVMSVGDLIEGYTTDTTQLHKEWDHFDSRTDHLAMPFFYVAGNHDISNSTMKNIWHQRNGRSYYHFVYKDVLFLVLNTEDMSEAEFQRMEVLAKNKKELMELINGKDYWEGTQTGVISGYISEEQINYFEQAIADNQQVRWTFIFMHTPMWQGEGSIALDKIESFLGERPFTAFAGHTHAYQHSKHNNNVHIRLGTTGGGWLPEDWVGGGKFDHIVMVSMTDSGPQIANLRLDGILDQYGKIPAGGEALELFKKKVDQ